MNVEAELQRSTENSTDVRLNDVFIEPEMIRAIMINEHVYLPTNCVTPRFSIEDGVSYLPI